jgi:aminoglycoside phosphotransferase (APT) family kinase protein
LQPASSLDIEDPDALVEYLRTRGLVGADDQPSIEILKGGVSNRVVRVLKPTGEAWVVKQALPKLRVAVDWYSSPDRIHREALGLRWLKALGLAVPELRFEDPDHHLLAMDAVPEPHVNWKSDLLGGRIDLVYVQSFSEMLVVMHANSFNRRAELQPIFKDTSYFESLRIEPYFAYTAQQVPAASTLIDRVIDATRANPLCLVHGDYSPKNVLIHDGALILLDHEVAHWGDPAFDLGFSMTHLLSKANHVEAKRMELQHAAMTFWDTYRTGVAHQPWVNALEPRAVESTLACLLARVAGRSQLEYLSAAERSRQLAAVIQLIATPPDTMRKLIRRFIGSLSNYEAS